METDNEKNLGDTKWNNLQKKDHLSEGLNEGFSAKNISGDYNPSEEKLEQQLRTEYEIDEHGNEIEVKRARFIDKDSPQGAKFQNPTADNKVIENKESLKNRDRNYDVEPNRYPASHPENKENRGNIETE